MKLNKTTNSESHLDVTYRWAIIIGQLIGCIVFLGGIVLCLFGLAGAIELIFEGGGLKARLLNASPGVVITFLGFLVLWRYKPIVKQDSQMKKSQTRRETPSGSRYVSSSHETYESKTAGSRLASPYK
jgi:hypothetical protein